jgi:hypothetical protein
MPTPQMIKQEEKDINAVPFNQDHFILKSFDSEAAKEKYAQIEIMIKKLNNNEDELLHSIY